MTPALLKLLLWIPFLAVFLVAGLIFCISGYKKGLWRSLISLGVTIVSALISMLLSKLIARGISSMVTLLIVSEDSLSDTGLPISFMIELAEGIISCILALIFFSMLMFVLTFVLKLVANAIKREELITTEKGYKWGGLGVRLVDALLYTLLLLLPLYGSIQAYVPTMQTLMNFVDDEETTEQRGYVDALVSHPVVVMSKTVSPIYNGLQIVSVGDASINIPQIVETVNKSLKMLTNLMTKDSSEYGDEELELIEYLRKNVVNKDWVYAICNEILSATKTLLMSETDNENIRALLPLFDMTKDQFKETGTAVLDFLELMIRDDAFNKIKNDEYDITALYDSGIFIEMLRVVNSSDQLFALKTMSLKDMIVRPFKDDKEMLDKFLNTANFGKLTTDEQLKAEAEALVMMSDMSGTDTTLEFVARHPMFTAESLDFLLNNYKLSYLLGIYDEDDFSMSYASGRKKLAEYIDSNAVRTKLISKLRECAASPIDGNRFGDYVNSIISIDSAYSTSRFNLRYYPLFRNDGEAVKYALELLDDHIAENYSDRDDMLKNIISAAADTANSDDFVPCRTTISGLISISDICTLITTLEPTDELNNILLGALCEFYTGDETYKLLEVMSKDDTDPLGLDLTDEQKSMLKRHIDKLLEKIEEASELESPPELPSIDTFVPVIKTASYNIGGATIQLLSGDESDSTIIDGSWIIDSDGNIHDYDDYEYEFNNESDMYDYYETVFETDINTTYLYSLASVENPADITNALLAFFGV